MTDTHDRPGADESPRTGPHGEPDPGTGPLTAAGDAATAPAGEPGAGTAVEFAYEVTVADLADSLNGRLGATPSGRRTRWLLRAAGVGGAVWLVGTALGDPVFTELLPPAMFLVIGFGLTPVVHFLQARQVHTVASRQGPFRAVATAEGVRLVSRDTDTTHRWGMYTRYTETDTVFVLLTGDKHGAGMLTLPKRGATAPDGADRLRTLLDAHIERV
ncbi:YcxB family protein [Streptomyces sp. t39]|uniref:YcxB family protein n=1 Tax=Streptomyces sp. t39 TaxID=1828156 RepID=UPI0011CEAC88|nr:YcxB family protein [Streptomyces sp. t39]TXS55073.1 YcxB family protein [Streptomyces sp. t39]